MTPTLSPGPTSRDTDANFDGFLYRRRRTVLADSGSRVDTWVMRADTCRMAVERVLPDAAIEICINLGPEGRHEFSGTSSQRLPHRASWVVGPRAAPLLIEKEVTDSHVIGVRIPSSESHRILGVPASELREGMVDLDALWGRDAVSVRDRLGECDNAQDRVAVMLDAVLARVRLAPVETQDCTTRARFLLQHDAQSSVSEIADQCGLTHRRLIDLVERTTGLKPKALRRVLRIRAVLSHIHATPRPSWTRIAASCGYYDQAHLINDFRQMTGMSPSAYEETRSSVGIGTAPYLLASECGRSAAAS